MHTALRVSFVLAAACLLLAGCTTKNVVPSAQAEQAPAASESIRSAQISQPLSATAAFKATAAPKVRKKSCKVEGAFELDCGADKLYAGVEPMHHPIDDSCPVVGTGSSDALKLEYSTKNSLCVEGNPTTVTISDFLTLQADLDHCGNLNLGSLTKPPEDRSCLKQLNSGSKHLSEGMTVRLVAYVEDSHPNTGEGVNCSCSGAEANDFHITLVTNKSDLACSGIVAEMIPHFRPEEWTNDAVEGLKGQGKPVRVEGPLFADTGHLPKPCGGTNTRSDPVRASVWEIHPIKRFQVCQFKSRTKCKADDDTVWDELPAPQVDE
jgi:hypothetical protein